MQIQFYRSFLADLIRKSSVHAGNTAHVMPPVTSSIVVLVTAALEDAANDQGVWLPDQWCKDQAATIVLVPDISWIAPMTVALDARGGAVHATPSRETSQVSSDLDVLLRIEDGRSVWVATNIAQVPDLARRAAECVVSVKGLTSMAVAGAISRITGMEIAIEDSDWRGLPLPLIASAIRASDSAQVCRDRLRRFSAPAAKTVDSTTEAKEDDHLSVSGPPAAWMAETLAVFEGLKTGSLPKSLLRHTILLGPPGCGKSTLVDHLARRAATPLERMSVGALFATGSGHLDSVVRQMLGFTEALRAHNKPAIGVIEEIDALCTRTGGTDSNSAYWSTVITSMLLAIDDLNASDAPVLLVGCTNRLQDVDAALRRPGRIGRIVEVTPPQTIDDVMAILRVHLAKDLSNIPLQDLARLCVGESQAQLADRVTAARTRALLAGRALDIADLYPFGAGERDKHAGALKKAALHEAAHAVVAYFFGRRVEAMDLRLDHIGMVTGITRLTPRLEGASYDERIDDCCIALAGRSADNHFGDRVDDGSATDLIQASHALALLYLSTGLSETLLALPPDVVSQELTTNLILQDTVESTLQEQICRADELVKEHREKIECLAAVLLDRRALNSAEIAATLSEWKS